MTIQIKDAVITLTGARGVGKTTMAATFLPPSEIGKVFYHDSEHSANNIRAQLKRQKVDFGHYTDLASRFGNIKDADLLDQINKGKLPWVDTASRNALVEYYEYVLRDLNDNLTPGKYKVYVHDSLEKLEAGMSGWVEANKKAAGVTVMAYGRMWTDSVYPLYENLLSAIFSRGVEVIILTSHLKTPWQGTQQIIGKVEPAGKKLLYRLSSLMLWLVHSRTNSDGSPAALVLKERLGNVGIGDKDEWELSRRLPERIPSATWKNIRGYLKKGVNLAEPGEGESMSQGELEMISELLSDQQMKLMVLQAETEAREASIVPPATGTFTVPGASSVSMDKSSPEVADTVAAARAMFSEGKSKSETAQALGVTLPELIRMLR